ncbi:MAG: IMP dehydrogenase [archaeon]
MVKPIIDWGLTFDDILLIPKHSAVLPGDVDVSVKLTKRLTLNTPLISAAMDTVTEARSAIALAREGAIGVIHRNMPADVQAAEVRKVKKSESWVIYDPLTLSPGDTVGTARAISADRGIASFPIIDKDGLLVGIVTNRDLRFKEDERQKLSQIMTTDLIKIDEGVSMDKAFSLMNTKKVEKLPIVDKKGRLKGLITIKDIERSKQYPNTLKDAEGHLKVAAATGPTDIDRVKALVEAKVDLIVVDTAHGHSENVLKAVAAIKKNYDVDVMAGNVATAEGAEALIKAGADIIKVGVGPGAICTTRVVTGVGVPQCTAVLNAVLAARKHGIPVVADGGIKFSGDVAKAIGIGASAVMIGSLFAGTEETPGRTIFVAGRKYKKYRGMGSIGAMMGGSKDRYGQAGVPSSKLVPEGIEGIVPYRGSITEVVYQLVGGLRASMGYLGAKDIKDFHRKAEFIKITAASLRESHPHDIKITEEAPNYQTSDPLPPSEF